jgi:transcriptional regulator with GAF, ATPase, and Fis domain
MSACVENEKDLLLEFSNDLASVHTESGLKSVLKKFLKERFKLAEYIITLRNDDNHTYRYFLHDSRQKDPDDEGFRIITGPKMPIEGAMTGAVLRSAGPVIFEVSKVRTDGFSFPSASFWRRAGAAQIRGMRLLVAKEDIGIIWTQPHQINDALLIGISAQISIAISNVLLMGKIDFYKRQLENENKYLQEQINSIYGDELIGTSTRMQTIFASISQVARTNATVLILGETGTGKELVARALHQASHRRNRLMVKVNCAALPPETIESELFGHERGAFTNAFEKKIGKFELAGHSTLFLDEIGEMPIHLQTKILRALQEKEIERLGGKMVIKTDIRIIAATNRDLQRETEEGRFRGDLYYRLNVFPIEVPPLREHKEDIPLLARHFLNKHAKNALGKVEAIGEKAMRQLMQYDWPGNVRELEHVIERSLIGSIHGMLKEVQLPARSRRLALHSQSSEYIRTAAEAERDHILFVLEKCRGKIFGAGGAAEKLGLPPSTLNSRIKKLNIKSRHQYRVK